MMRGLGANLRLAGVAVAMLIVGIAIGMWLVPRGPAAAPTSERQVLYWFDPMVPDQHFDKPGKSPFMDMQLVPRYADEAVASGGVRVDPAMVQNLGMRTAIITRGLISSAIRASGVIDYNGRAVAVVQARQGGFVERARGRAVGDLVDVGDPIIDLRVPDWNAAIAEYLALRKGDASIAAAARQRLAMLGTPEDAVAAAMASGQAPATFTIRAPISGALTALDVRDGMALAPGAAIATINGLSPVWLTVSVPQSAAGPVASGGRAIARLQAFPGETFEGRIEAVLPTTNAASRAVEVRIALPNPERRLKPGMTGEVEVTEESPRAALLAPSEAIIRTGQRTLVIVAADGGRYEPIEVVIGVRAGEFTEIVSGLGEGQRIVASGQFLIDSEASLAGVVARLSSGASRQAQTHQATGRVTAVDAAGVTLAHGPVPALDWPAMTMTFRWGPSGAQTVAVSDDVRFTFHKEGADFVLDSIAAAGGRP
jgi:membrane fusion protein, copper/silver efflux system